MESFKDPEMERLMQNLANSILGSPPVTSDSSPDSTVRAAAARAEKARELAAAAAEARAEAREAEARAEARAEAAAAAAAAPLSQPEPEMEPEPESVSMLDKLRAKATDKKQSSVPDETGSIVARIKGQDFDQMEELFNKFELEVSDDDGYGFINLYGILSYYAGRTITPENIMDDKLVKTITTIYKRLALKTHPDTTKAPPEFKTAKFFNVVSRLNEVFLDDNDYNKVDYDIELKRKSLSKRKKSKKKNPSKRKNPPKSSGRRPMSPRSGRSSGRRRSGRSVSPRSSSSGSSSPDSPMTVNKAKGLFKAADMGGMTAEERKRKIERAINKLSGGYKRIYNKAKKKRTMRKMKRTMRKKKRK